MLLLSAAAALVGGACDVRVGFEKATRSLKSCGFPRSVRLRRGPCAAFSVGSKSGGSELHASVLLPLARVYGAERVAAVQGRLREVGDKLIERANVAHCSGGFAEAVLLRRRYAVMKTRHAPAADESSYSGSTKTARNEDLQALE